MHRVFWYHSVCDFSSLSEQWHWSLKWRRSLIYRLFAFFFFFPLPGSEAGGEDALVGNVNKLMMSPPGYSGASRKGHLVFDACFESGKYLSPVRPAHGIPVIELLVFYTLIWWWRHTGSFFRSTHMFCPSLVFFFVTCRVSPTPVWRSGANSCQLAYVTIILLSGTNLFI